MTGNPAIRVITTDSKDIKGYTRGYIKHSHTKKATVFGCNLLILLEHLPEVAPGMA